MPHQFRQLMEMNLTLSGDSDEMPELESIPDDENEEVFIPIKTLHHADPDRVVQLTDVSIMVYPDNTIQVDKNTDELVKLRQIVNGPMFSSIMFYEQWATGNGGASKAFNNFEANQIWNKFGRDSRVNIYRMIDMLRRAGIFHCYCDLSIKDCTEVLDVFRYEDTGLKGDFELDSIPIFAPPKLVKQYQEQMGRMVGFTEVAMMLYQASQIWCNELDNVKLPFFPYFSRLSRHFRLFPTFLTFF